MQKSRFTLVKYHHNDKTTVKWNELVNVNDDAHIVPHAIDGSSMPPHMDMKRALRKLRPIILQAMSLNHIEVIKNDPTLSEEQKEAFRIIQDRIDAVRAYELDSIVPTGVAISGKDNELVKIFFIRNGVSIATPMINMNGESQGFETELLEILDEIVNEAYLFITEHKSAQIEIMELQ